MLRITGSLKLLCAYTEQEKEQITPDLNQQVSIGAQWFLEQKNQ
jgi:hypothetical protein